MEAVHLSDNISSSSLLRADPLVFWAMVSEGQQCKLHSGILRTNALDGFSLAVVLYDPDEIVKAHNSGNGNNKQSNQGQRFGSDSKHRTSE